ECLARGGEMYLEFSGSVAVVENFFQRALDRLPDRHGLIVGKEAVAVQFDENPIWPAAHSDMRPAPPVQAAEIERVILGQCPVVETRYGQSPEPAPPVENEGARKNHRQYGGDAHPQIGSRAVGCPLMERAATLVNCIDPGHLRPIGRSG